jgi:hypothetical protein
MFQSVIDFLSAPFTELIIFILLVAYFAVYRHRRHLTVTGITWLRVSILIIIFIYFAWMPIVWPSLIPAGMLALSVFGMFVINFYFFYSLVLAHFEQPYRAALAELSQESDKREVFRQIWSSGKIFYYGYYLFQSLISGSNPIRFLKEMATDRVENDIKDELRREGVKKKLISLNLMVSFLKNRLHCDTNLPADFKELMGKTIDNLEKHPWLEEHVNEFLHIAMETPENLHFPDWISDFEQCSSGNK